MSRNTVNALAQARLNSVRGYYLDAMERFETDRDSAPRLDDDGNWTFEVLGWVNHQESVRLRVALPGKSSLVHFADVQNGLFGDETIYVSKIVGRVGKRFYSDLDRPDLGNQLFAFGGSVPKDKVIHLFAAMLRYPRAEDVELLDGLHPARKVFQPVFPGRGEPNIVAYDQDRTDHVDVKERIEFHLGDDWACIDGILLARTQEPYFTVLAPEKTTGNIEITSCVGDHYLSAPFATFAADRKSDVEGFANMLVQLGSGIRAAGGCEIVLRAPEYVTARNHGTEIANSAWAIAERGYGRERETGFDDFNEAAEGAGGFFPHWSTGGYWVDPYERRDDRDNWQERWNERWKSVSGKIGPMTIERLRNCGSDKVRARMRLKVIIDYLTWGGDFWKPGNT